jgi:hypothetical protein
MSKPTPAATEWFEPTLANINDDAWYLVKTNGMEWRDHDLFVWRGIMVAIKLRPDYVRGRPILIARINAPDAKQEAA